MTSNSYIEISPIEIQHIPRHIEDTQSILLGGPCTGKTNICQSLDGVKYINTAGSLKSVDTSRPIILDNAYQILSDPELDAAEWIDTLEKHTAGICYVFRPYELEWIVGQQSGINFDLDSKQLLSLVYSRSEAITNLHGLDSSLPESKVTSFVDDLEYEFSFANAPIDDYHSYLPYCPVKASNTAIERIITGESVATKINDFAEQSDISAFARFASSQLPGSMTATLSGVVGGGALASGMSTVALFAVIPILLSRTLNDDHEFERNLGKVLGHKLFPHHQERLERKTNLPPRTFETLAELTDPVTAHRLDTVVEKQNELRTAVQEADTSVEDDINSLTELVDQLATETIPITELISKEFNDAILDPEALTRRQKNRITEELEAAATISEAEAQERVDELFSRPLREEKLDEDFANRAPDQGALLVHGEMGGGTTTFARGLLEQYARDGYDVGVIDSTTPEILRPKLRSMRSNSERLALVYSVGRERSISPHDFQILFGEEVFEFYDVIIIECSQEQVDSIRSAWKKTRANSHVSAKSRLEPKAEIQLSSIDDEILERIPRTLSSLDNEDVERIADTADGNPTIAVEATLETLEKGVESISGVRGRGLIRSRLKGVLEELRDNHGEEPVDILVMLAAIRGVDDEKELADLLDSRKKRVRMYLEKPISAYIHKRSDGTLVVSPRIYALTIFELKWFTELSGEWLSSDQGERFAERIRDSSDQNVVGLATTLAELQANKLNTSSAPSTAPVISCIEDLLEQSGHSRLPKVLAATGMYQVPIQLEVLYDSNRLRKSLYAIFESSDDESLEVAGQYLPLFTTGLAGVTVAAYNNDDRSAERFLAYGTNLFREIVDTKHEHPKLANLLTIRYYSTVLSPLVHTFDLDDIRPFVKEVTGRAAGVQNSSDVSDVFLVEFYSQILAPHVEVNEEPDNYNEWLNFIIEEITDANEQPGGLTGLDMPSDELIAGESRQFQTSPDRVVIQVFARAIITNPPRDPTDRLQWIEDTEARLKRFRTRLNKRSDDPTESTDEDEGIMSLPLWAAILGQLADFHSPDWAREWIAMAEQRLAEEFDSTGSPAQSQEMRTNLGGKPMHDGWAKFVGDVIFEKRHLAEPEEWTKRLVELVKEQAREASYSGLIELRSYAWILCRAVQSHIATENKEFIETWVQWYFDHAAEPADSDVLEVKPDVAFTEPFVVAPECFQVDLQTDFVNYLLKYLETETENPKYAVAGGCARIFLVDTVPVSELFEWVYEIICCFAVRQDNHNFDLSIASSYAGIIIYILDLQSESLTRKVAEDVLPKLSEREGSEAIFDIIVLTIMELSQMPFEEFHENAEIIVSATTDNLAEEERKELRNNVPDLLDSESDSEYIDKWIEGLMNWTQH